MRVVWEHAGSPGGRRSSGRAPVIREDADPPGEAVDPAVAAA
jgi:hypothetical protein